MFADNLDLDQKSSSYKLYVLALLLVVCIHNLTARNLPSYLITVQVPGCEDKCAGVATPPLCGDARWTQFPADQTPTRYEACQICRSGSTYPAVTSSKLKPMGQENRTAVRLMAVDTVQRQEVLHASNLYNATFYNMADGACLHDWEYGILIGYGFAMVFAIGSIPAGYIVDIKPRIAVASISLFIWSLATSLQASAHGFLFLLCSRAALGLSQAFAMPAAISMIADIFRDQLHMAMVVLSVGLYVGQALASLSIWFALLLGWRWTVLLSGWTGILIAGLLLFTVKDPPRSPEGWVSPVSMQLVIDEVFYKSRVARLLLVAASAKLLAAYVLSSYLALWFARSNMPGYSNSAYAGWNALVIVSGGLLSTFVGSYLGEYWSKLDHRAPCWIGVAGSIISLPLLCLVLTLNSFTWSMLCLFLLLLASESWFAPTMTLLRQSVRQSVRGQAVSMFLVATTLVANIGPAIVGFCDPGTEVVGVHILWITLAANIAAAVAFFWTATEIDLDPVAAGFGASFGDEEVVRKGPAADRPGVAHMALF